MALPKSLFCRHPQAYGHLYFNPVLDHAVIFISQDCATRNGTRVTELPHPRFLTYSLPSFWGGLGGDLDIRQKSYVSRKLPGLSRLETLLRILQLHARMRRPSLPFHIHRLSTCRPEQPHCGPLSRGCCPCAGRLGAGWAPSGMQGSHICSGKARMML